MASIDELLLRSTNPFDNLRSVNFWLGKNESDPIVASIHQEEIVAIEEQLDQVIQFHQTRTVILDGDSGSGKTYLLGRLKRSLNHQAFFAYIPPFPQSDYVWRHILRYTIDSLLQVPTDKTDSQLMLWLKGILFTIKQRNFKDLLFKDDVFDLVRSDRQKFIHKLKTIYEKAGIYNANTFFGILYDLTKSELWPLACEWLRGDDLNEESLQKLQLESSINTEQAAREILSNFGRVAADTQPIVLCFDQLESIARLGDGALDIQTLFNVNTKIHDEDQNFLIIISITTHTWKKYESQIDLSHKARFNRQISLRNINLDQAVGIWASRLSFLHHHATPQPDSPIYPLSREYLQREYPRGKINPGDTLSLGRQILQAYKQWLISDRIQPFEPKVKCKKSDGKTSDLLPEFKLKWQEELTKAQEKVTKIRFLSSPELIQMLQEALMTIEVEKIQVPLLHQTKFASYSLGYQSLDPSEKVGIVWTEDPNMTTFFNVMKACQKATEQKVCNTLTLIRSEGIGQPRLKGYQIYQQIFTSTSHRRVEPDIGSVHCLVAYYCLVKDAREGDLVIAGEVIAFKQLQTLIRESGVLQDCLLLQKLRGKIAEPDPVPKKIRDYLLNLAQIQQIIGLQTFKQHALQRFPHSNDSSMMEMIDQLCADNQLQILNPTASPEAKLVCWIPNS